MKEDLEQNHMCKIMNREPGLEKKMVSLVAQRLFGRRSRFPRPEKIQTRSRIFQCWVKYSVRKQKEKTRERERESYFEQPFLFLHILQGLGFFYM